MVHENKKITPDKDKMSGVIQFFKESLLCWIFLKKVFYVANPDTTEKP